MSATTEQQTDDKLPVKWDTIIPMVDVSCDEMRVILPCNPTIYALLVSYLRREGWESISRLTCDATSFLFAGDDTHAGKLALLGCIVTGVIKKEMIINSGGFVALAK